jgi:hypothetical protein
MTDRDIKRFAVVGIIVRIDELKRQAAQTHDETKRQALYNEIAELQAEGDSLIAELKAL